MIKSEKKLRELAVILEKDNPILVSEAIGMLRNEEAFEGAVNLLATCYERSDVILIKRAVENFFNNLKDNTLRSEIIHEIKKDRNQSTISMLVSSCWQSGLDYSGYIEEFARIFLRSDYGTALECFTVIEGAVLELNSSEREKVVKLINENQHSAGPKQPLLLELLSMLQADVQSSD